MDEAAKKNARAVLCTAPSSDTLSIFEEWGSDALKRYAATMGADIKTRRNTKGKLLPVIPKRRREEEVRSSATVDAFTVMREAASRGSGERGEGGGGGRSGGGGSPSAEVVQAVKDKIGAGASKKARVPPPQGPAPSQGLGGLVAAAVGAASAAASFIMS